MVRRQCFDEVNRRVYLGYPNQVYRFKSLIGYWPNVAQPGTYNERMLWRKVFDHNPLFQVFCHKLDTKEYSRRRVPDLKLPETYWRGKSVREMPDELLRKDGFIKAAHSCDRNHRHRSVPPDSIPKVREELIALTKPWMRHTYGKFYHQWGYLGIDREIFMEELIETSDPLGLLEMNVRCANGRALIISATRNHKLPMEKVAYFDQSGQCINVSALPGEDPRELDSKVRMAYFPELPHYFEKLIRAAESLSVGIDYARYDFICNTTDYYGGEITVYPAAGVLARSPMEFLPRTVMSAWDLRNSWFLTTEHQGWRGEYAKRYLQALNDSPQAA